MRAFCTGSRVYGEPREDSDVDLVVLCDDRVIDTLKSLADNGVIRGAAQTDPGPRSASLWFGQLNLILVTDEDAFAVWKLGTRVCVDRAAEGEKVTRDWAMEKFAWLREKFLG